MEDEQPDIELLLGVVSRQVELIGAEAERLSWDELVDELSFAFGTRLEDLKPEEKFYTLVQFAFRLLWRVKKMEEKLPFNIVEKTSMLEGHEDKEFFRLKNYNFKSFRWALDRELDKYIDNMSILIPMDALKPSEIKHFEKQMKK